MAAELTHMAQSDSCLRDCRVRACAPEDLAAVHELYRRVCPWPAEPSFEPAFFQSAQPTSYVVADDAGAVVMAALHFCESSVVIVLADPGDVEDTSFLGVFEALMGCVRENCRVRGVVCVGVMLPSTLNRLASKLKDVGLLTDEVWTFRWALLAPRVLVGEPS